MFNIKKGLILLWMSFLGLASVAQQPVVLTLEQARIYAGKHNYELRNAQLDIETARYKVKETVATGLPQISASINYNDNIGLPVQLVPGDFFGRPGEDIEVQFGTKYSANAGASVNQLLFSGSYLVGLQASKAYLEQSKKNLFKNQVEVNKAVSESYFLVLATKESILVIDSTLEITRKLAKQTKIIVENGFAEETEFDQLQLLIADLETGRMNAVSQLETTKSYLRYHLGMDEKQQIDVAESLVELTEKLVAEKLFTTQFNLYNNIDFQILQNQKDLALLQVKLEKSAYLPTLSAFLNYNTQAQRQEWDFFDSKGKWYSSSVLGVSMNIPVFSGGERSSRVRQAQYQFEKTQVAEEMVSSSLNLQYQTIRNELENALQTYQNTKNSKGIAEKIFRRTGVKYTEGMAASLDLLNTQNQYLTSQSQYINAALNMLNKTVALESILIQSQ
ncbi:MAG: TolC family protein [Bacteroidales bacterium]|nr:TolC family protein [Bacteroidales bacterium]